MDGGCFQNISANKHPEIILDGGPNTESDISDNKTSKIYA
jgi:hypothetical protein